MAWEKGLEELRKRREWSLELGGKERVDRQHSMGKLTIRERMDKMLDQNSFMEFGQLTGKGEYDPVTFEVKHVVPSGYVMGLGKIDGRYVAIGGEDFTVHGGAAGGLQRRKGGQGGFIEELAYEYRIPLINFNEGAGADVSEAMKMGYKRMPFKEGFERSVSLLGMVPVCGILCGPTAGGPAGRVMLTHFSVVVKNSAQVFAAGPPVVERALGHKLTKEELGGHEVCCDIAGSIDNPAENEEDAMDQVRKFLSYLPSNVWEMAPRVYNGDPIDRRDDELLDIIPEKRSRRYDMRRIINILVDKDSFFEIGPTFGQAVICGFARFNGYPVGLTANNPMSLAGAPDAKASRKFLHFSDVCNLFNIPVVHLVDCPGFMLGRQAEMDGTLRYGMASVFNSIDMTVPRFSVMVRKCYGMAAGAYFRNGSTINRLAWPSSEFGSLPIEGGTAASFRRELAAAPDPEKRLKEIEDQLRAYSSPFRSAEHFAVEELCDPRETRFRLCTMIEASQHFVRSNLGLKPRYGVRPA